MTLYKKRRKDNTEEGIKCRDSLKNFIFTQDRTHFYKIKKSNKNRHQK